MNFRLKVFCLLFTVGNFTAMTATATTLAVKSFSPAAGPVGTVVTVTGSGFTTVNQIWLGSAHNISPDVQSDSQLVFTVPETATSGEIVALDPQPEAAFSSRDFTVTRDSFPQPGISSFSPTSGPVGTVVKVTGSGFTGANAIWLGSSHNINPTVVSDSEINFTVPAGATNGEIVVLNSQHAGFSSSMFEVSQVSSSPNDLIVKVSGNHLVDGNGHTLQLRGANMGGLATVGVQQLNVSTWEGTYPNWAVYKTWRPNAIRLPLNVGSWLGKLTYEADANPATEFGKAVNPDPQGDYRQAVFTAIAAAQAQGLYVIIDLHWSAPEVTLGGVTHYITPNGQPEFMNASTDIPFWLSMAQTFGTNATPQPGINNKAILFELFNEPYIDYYAAGSNLYDLMLNGGTVDTFHWALGAYSVTPVGGVQIAGYQQALNTIRGTGAENVCIINGPSWTQEAKNYKQWFPTDSLPKPQLAAGWHPYPHGKYPYSDGDVYGQIGTDPGAGTPQFSQWYDAILADGIPVLITEDGGEGGTEATSGEPHMAYMQSWADENNVSYIGWEWDNTQSYGKKITNNYMCVFGSDNKTILPIEGEGQEIYNWLYNHK